MTALQARVTSQNARLFFALCLALCGILFAKTVHAQSVSPSHPRIWLTSSRLSRLKAYATRNTVRWQKLKASADWYLTVDPTPDPLLYLAGAKNCAIVYQVTGDVKYAQCALRLATFFAIPSNTLGDGFDYRDAIPNVTFALDWCYDQATPAQRTQLETWLMDRADALWPETNPYAGNRWAVADAGNNYFWGYMYAWPAALACYGDEPRAAVHAQLGLIKYRTIAQPFLNSYGAGGIFSEGTNYDSAMYLGEILDGYDTASGQDLINAPDNTFLHDSLYWRIYSACPSKDYQFPMGAQSRVPSAPLFDYDRWRANVGYSNITDGALASYTKNWLDTITPNISSLDGVLADEFLYYDEDHQALDYTALPTSYYAPGMGFLTNRSDWTTNATYWGIWAGPNFEAHADQDVNGFSIWKNGWLAGNDSVWSTDGTLGQTIYHNNLTFGGLQQTWQGPDASYPDQAGRVLTHEVASDYTYFAGQGAQAYVQNHNDPTPPVSDYVRKYVWISPNTFFVYDRATVADATAAKEWHLHSLNPITISGRDYRFNNGNYQLVGRSLLPSTGTTLSTSPVIYKTDTPTSYRLDVVSANNTATDYLLNVLQLTPIGSATPTSTTVESSTGNMEGAACSGWVVMFGKTDQVTGPVSYSTPSGTTVQNLVCDQVPNLNYTVSYKTSAGSTGSQVVKATASGSLRFAVPGGSTVTLSTSDAIPFTIAGRVVDATSGIGIFDATVTCAGHTAKTDTSGLYFLTGLAAGSYTVAVSKANYAFSANQTLAVGPNKIANFTGQVHYATTYTISGTITANGQTAPVAGATVSADGQSATTDANGVYTITGIPAGTWVVSASAGGYVLSRPQLATVAPSATGINFTATWIGFKIYGTVRCNGVGLAGVTATTGGKSVTTLADGTYIIAGLSAGDYSVTAAAPGYSMSGAQPASIGPYDATGVDFKATSTQTTSTYSIAGNVTVNGTGLAGVTVSAGSTQVVTASNGAYTLTNIAAGSYTVGASLSGYTLSAAHSVTVGPSATAVNFTATNSTTTTTPTYSVSGTVNGPSGPLAGAVLTAGTHKATSTSTGTYTITGIPAGAYSVTAVCSGYSFAARSLTVGPSQSGVTFTGTAVTVVSTPGLKINCGGPAYTGATGSWHADEYASGGAPYTFDGLAVTGTSDPAILRTMRYGYSDFSYNLPASAGSYTLKLGFTEGDSSALVPGTRLFDVYVNGTRVLASFDVCRSAGGIGIALVKTFTVTAGSTGGVVVRFHPIASSAIVSAIVLEPISAAKSIYIDSGNGGITPAASSGWSTDSGFSGGDSFTFTGLAITGTTTPDIFASLRYSYSSFGYQINAPAGSYNLRLGFVEGDSRASTPGYRTFDVSANGKTILSNFDVYKTAGGLGKAVVETIPVTVGSAGLALKFTAVSSSAMVSTIELDPAS